MVHFIDVFGTDDFFRDRSDPMDLLRDIDSYISNNIAQEVKNRTDDYEDWEVAIWAADDERVDISNCECFDYCYGYDIEERRAEADDWLESNHDVYSSATLCIVLDHHDECTGDEPFGASSQDGWNTDKTILVNTAVDLSNDLSDSWGEIVAHEIGHTLDATHDDTAVSESRYQDDKATWMWSIEVDGESTDCDSGTPADSIAAKFSQCAIEAINSTLD